MLLKNQYSLFPIGLGAMPLSVMGRPSVNEAIDIILSFLQRGGNFIDTADIYGLDETDGGHNEKIICKALRVAGNPDNVLVATKGGATRPNGGWGMRGGHPEKIRKVCEQSLLNLKRTEHPLYYLHGIDPDVPLEDSLGELIKLQHQGKIRHIGIANVDMEELQRAVSLTTIAAVQNRCNPFCKGDLRNGVVDFCESNDILYVPYCPLGGWQDHAKLSASPLYLDLATRHHISSYVISLTWLRSLGKHVLPIPGIDNKNQLEINFQSLNFSLSMDDLQQLDAFPDLYLPKHLEVS